MRKMALGICLVPCVMAPHFIASLSMPPEPPAPDEPVMIGVVIVVVPLMPVVLEPDPELLPATVLLPEVLAEPAFDPAPPPKVEPLESPHPLANARAKPMKTSESAEQRSNLIGSSESPSTRYGR